VHSVKRHFPFVLGGFLALIGLLVASLPFTSKPSGCGSLLSSHDGGGGCTQHHEVVAGVVALIVLIALVIVGTYAVFLFFERREAHRIAAQPVETPTALDPTAEPAAVAADAAVVPVGEAAAPAGEAAAAGGAAAAPTLEAMPPRVSRVLDRVPVLVTMHPEIVAVALVGAWATGAGTDASDIDMVVIASDPTALLATDDWHRMVNESAQLVRSSSFGAITERRLRLTDGMQVSVGIAAPGWLSTKPMYPATAQVLAGGTVVVHDPKGMLQAAIDAAGKAATAAG
jgi:hypothetical protein